MLFVGVRAGEPAPCAALRELLDVTELPVVETFQAAGVVSRELEDHFVGRVGLFRNQPGDIVIGRADVLVTVGFDPVEYDPRLWNADPGRTLIHIDEVPADIDNYYQPTLELRGDIAATLSELTVALTGLQLDNAAREHVAEQRAALSHVDDEARNRPQTDFGVNPVAVVLQMRALPWRRRHGHLRCGIALHLHGPALPGVPAAAAAVLRWPADARCRVAVGDGCRTGSAGHSGRVGLR